MSDSTAKPNTQAPAASTTNHSLTVWEKVKRDALKGGIPAMAAVVVQVTTLMWLRTAVNYQYRHGGTSMIQAIKELYKQGGIRRFYSGYPVALIQAPLSRFGDTAANASMLAIFDHYEALRELPIFVKTVGSSVGAGSFRIALMPVDALKTSLQVDGKAGFGNLVTRVKEQGPTALYRGALAASVATFVGHYPWFATYNTLNVWLPEAHDFKTKLLRSAALGFSSSFVSDCCSNSIRVVKTVRQTSGENLSYKQVVDGIIQKDGLIGLFGRGLTTKLATNGIQGIMFSVLWRLGQDAWDKKKE